MFSLQPLEVVSGGRLDHRLSLPGRKPSSPANLRGKKKLQLNMTYKHDAIISHSLVLHVKYACLQTEVKFHAYSYATAEMRTHLGNACYYY
jgi:hypothetical protein